LEEANRTGIDRNWKNHLVVPYLQVLNDEIDHFDTYSFELDFFQTVFWSCLNFEEISPESRYEPEKKNQNIIKIFKSKLYLIPLGLLKVCVFKESPSTRADYAHFW